MQTQAFIAALPSSCMARPIRAIPPPKVLHILVTAPLHPTPSPYPSHHGSVHLFSIDLLQEAADPPCKLSIKCPGSDPHFKRSHNPLQLL